MGRTKGEGAAGKEIDILIRFLSSVVNFACEGSLAILQEMHMYILRINWTSHLSKKIKDSFIFNRIQRMSEIVYFQNIRPYSSIPYSYLLTLTMSQRRPSVSCLRLCLTQATPIYL